MKFRLFVMLFVFVSLFNVVNAQILEVSFDKDFISSGDSVVIKIIANIDNTPILPRQLQVNFKGQDLFFRTCEQLTIDNTDSLTAAYIGSSRCSVTLSNIVKNDKDVEELIFTLFRPNGETVGTFNKNIYFDEYPPRIVSISEVKAGEVMTGLNLVLEDSACEDCDSNECSGLDKVEMRIGSNVFEGEFVNQTILDGSCSQTITLTAVGHDLINDLSVIVYDELGNAAKDIFFWNPIPIIRDVKVSGEYGYHDGNFGWLRGYSSDDLFAQKDLLSISALVRKGSSLIAGNEFKVLIEDQIQNTFFVCERLVNPADELLGFYNCTGKVNFDTDGVEEGVNQILEIRMLKQSGEEFLDASGNYIHDAGNFKVDFTVPEISLVDDGFEEDTSSNNYSIDVSASDEKGLLKFELYDGLDNLNSGNYFRVVDLGGSKEIESTLDKLDNIYFDYNGYKNIYVKVYDVVGHSAYTNVSLYFDTVLPSTNGGFKLFSSNDLAVATEYKYLSAARTMDAYVYFEVKDESEVNVVSVDASRLTMNPIKSRDYKSFNANQVSCVGTGSVKKCVFLDPVSVILDDVSNVYLNVTVEDYMGNKDYLIYEPEFEIDNDDPFPTKLSVGFCDEEFGCFVGNENPNPIVVEIKEPTSGFNINYCFERDSSGSCDVSGKNIKVDVSEWLDSDDGRIEHVLSGCINPNAGTWVCRGYFEASEDDFGENDERMSRVTSVVDDAGNMYRGSDAITNESVGDVNDPVVLEFKVIPLGNPEAGPGDGIHVRDGDKIKIVAKVADISPVNIRLNMSRIFESDYMKDMNCGYLEDGEYTVDEETDDDNVEETVIETRIWQCNWTSSRGVSVPVDSSLAGIKYAVEDYVGHVTQGINNTRIFLLEQNENDLIGIQVFEDQISPSYLNRKMLMIVPGKIDVPYKLDSLSSTVYKILSQNFMVCEFANEADNTNSPVYIERDFDETFYLPSHFLSSDEPSTPANFKTKYLMKTYLNENDRINEIAWINFTCDLGVYLGYQGDDGFWYMLENPEVKDFNWSINLEDSFMEPGMKIWEEIKSVNESILVQADWIFDVQKVFSIAQKSCSLIRNFNMFIQPVTALVSAWASANAAIGAFSQVPYLDFLTVLVDPQEKGCSGGILGEAKCKVDEVLEIPVEFVNKHIFNIGADEEGEGFKPIATMCDWIQCSHCDEKNAFRLSKAIGINLDRKKAEEPEQSSGNEDSKIRDAVGTFIPEWDAGTADWKNSFLASLNCMCIPGIVSKFQEFRQIECNYMTCLKDKATMGLSVSDCKLDRARFTCNYWMGELTMIGPMRAADAFMGALADTIASLSAEFNLATVLIGGASYVTCEWLLDEPKGIFTSLVDAALCKIPMAVNMAEQSFRQFNTTINNFIDEDGTYWNSFLDSINPISVPDVDACEPWVGNDDEE